MHLLRGTGSTAPYDHPYVPQGGLDPSFSLRAGAPWFCSVPSSSTNFCSFPCLMKASIYCFKSLHSNVSWSWSQWKRQYLSLNLLLGPPFNLPRNVKAHSSLICIKTWSIEVFKGVKFVNLPVRGVDRQSSLLSLVLAIFQPLSYRASSCLSLFLGFSSRANSASSAFMYLVAL